MMAYIAVIPYEESMGELKSIYDELIATRGKLADVHTVQSLNPATIVSHMNLYKDILFGPSPLKRYQRETVAVIVSAANQCEYCVHHHREALLHYWKDTKKIDKLIRQPDAAQLSEADQELCSFARDLTLNPELSTVQKVEVLKREGFTDRAILDATLAVAYFNFVNRIVLGLGLQVNASEITGYKY
jgi:uncharacterized peroxidase-related enzyme